MKMFLKAISGLLTYPQGQLISALPEIALLIENEPDLSAEHKNALMALVNELSQDDLLSSQETYVEVFDRGRATSLHLFEHVHGESRDRGMAMIDLRNTYEKAGLVLHANELPDYLPVVLEYLSTRSENEIRELLGDCAHILRKVGEALLDRGSHYSAVFATLLALVDEPGLVPTARRRPTAEEKSIDEEWAEEPVEFGPAAKPACNRAQAQSSVIRFVDRSH
ncbi:MAG: nitrate reductase molybdenum cofactor assembly chaperone [Betaproteobacteria bacterium]|nr:MAG: nitrate reductase molybdenum cofactor assembly chaperone [Betaproteobacteria bacterium]